MNTQFRKPATRNETPENYRNPGNNNSPAQIGPSTRQLLSVLINIETKTAT